MVPGATRHPVPPGGALLAELLRESRENNCSPQDPTAPERAKGGVPGAITPSRSRLQPVPWSSACWQAQARPCGGRHGLARGRAAQSPPEPFSRPTC